MKILLILLLFTVNCKAQDTILHICSPGHISKIDKGRLICVEIVGETKNYYILSPLLKEQPLIILRKGPKIKINEVKLHYTFYYSTYYKTIFNANLFDDK